MANWNFLRNALKLGKGAGRAGGHIAGGLGSVAVETTGALASVAVAPIVGTAGAFTGLLGVAKEAVSVKSALIGGAVVAGAAGTAMLISHNKPQDARSLSDAELGPVDGMPPDRWRSLVESRRGGAAQNLNPAAQPMQTVSSDVTDLGAMGGR